VCCGPACGACALFDVWHREMENGVLGLFTVYTHICWCHLMQCVCVCVCAFVCVCRCVCVCIPIPRFLTSVYLPFPQCQVKQTDTCLLQPLIHVYVCFCVRVCVLCMQVSYPTPTCLTAAFTSSLCPSAIVWTTCASSFGCPARV